MRQSVWLVCVVLISLTAAAERTMMRPARQAAPTGAALPCDQRPRHPATVAQVHEMMELTGANDVKQEMLDGLLPHVREMLPWMPADVVDDIRQSIAIADFDAAVIRAYQARLSTEDAAQIIAFLRTPAGRRMAGVLPQIQSEGEQAGASLGQEIMAQVIRRHQAEIEVAKEKYEHEHAGSAPQR
jgi:uncharacterized protein